YVRQPTERSEKLSQQLSKLSKHVRDFAGFRSDITGGPWGCRFAGVGRRSFVYRRDESFHPAPLNSRHASASCHSCNQLTVEKLWPTIPHLRFPPYRPSS